MTLRRRYAAFAVAGGVFLGLLVWSVTGLPAFGHYPGPYGIVLNHVAVAERHATNVVMAVTFDYRGVDTLVEEFILFASVMAVALLLRETRESGERSRDPARSDALAAVGLGGVSAAVVLGLYVVAHGTVTPGGGFQGGVALASALVVVFIGGSYGTFRTVSPTPLVDLAEGTGAGGFAAVGVTALALGAAFLHNFLPYGTSGTLASAGTITLLNAATALEVSAAFVLLATEFLDEVLLERADDEEDRGK